MRSLAKILVLSLLIVLTAFRNTSDTGPSRTELQGRASFIVPLHQDVMIPVGVQDVKAGGEIGRRVDITIKNNLLQLNIDGDFLSSFRKKDQTGGYIGIGKLIDATVRFAAYSRDPEVLRLKQYLVAELIKTQEGDGYIGGFIKEARMRKEWDIHEMAYIIYGLVKDYEYFNNQEALKSATRIADYIILHWPLFSADYERNAYKGNHLVTLGLDRAVLSLYSHTEDRRYLDFLTDTMQIDNWDLGINIGNPAISGHIYSYLARCLAKLELYHLRKDDRLLDHAMRAIRFLKEQDGMLITGGAGHGESWAYNQDGRYHSGETCSTAYQIRLLEYLMRMYGDPVYGDLMERTIYNALFAAQSPDGRMIRYFTPMEGEREYFDKDTYCCPNNFRRIISELPSMIFYHYHQGIAVNLYTASEAEIKLQNGPTVSVIQETDYPSSGLVKIIISPSEPSAFPVSLRIPSWAHDAEVSVNGNVTLSAEAGSFFTINCHWAKGDTITLNLPMEWRFVKGRQRQAGRFAIMRGPVVYCLNPGLNKLLELNITDDPGRNKLDERSIKGPFPYDAIRPGGTACKINTRKKDQSTYDFELIFTEFPDPQGTVCYFYLRNSLAGVDDELLGGTEITH